jgi:hypothetical protein
MKTCGEWGGIASSFVIFSKDGGKWSASLSYRYIPGKRDASTQCIRNFVGLRDGLDFVESSSNRTFSP